MRTKRNLSGTALWVLLSLLLSTPAFADPPADPSTAHRAKVPALDALRQARGKGKAPDVHTPNNAQEAVTDRGNNKMQSAALHAMHVAARRAKRDQARQARIQELGAKLKGRPVPTPLRMELRTHARRVSRLQRIRLLAGEDTVLVARIDALLTRETARHERRMNILIANAPNPSKAPATSQDDHDDEVEE